MQIFDETIKTTLETRVKELEAHFNADVVFYYGEFFPGAVKPFRDFIETLAVENRHGRNLAFFVNSPGGSAEVVEKLVEIMRYHYDHVSFVVPDSAMSAGTILCMSGNKIYMDYTSSLGPIDPQVQNANKQWVPALGYLDKVAELIEKSGKNTITDAELLLLQNQDLAMLQRYEQARDLTVTLLEKWLADYKFQNWAVHRTDPTKLNQPVTLDEKKARAANIAKGLGNNKLWHSHGRRIGVTTLQRVLRLEIDDYSADAKLKPLIRAYNDLLTEYIARHNIPFFLHNRNYF